MVNKNLRYDPRDPSKKIRSEILKISGPTAFMATHFVKILSKSGWMRVPGPACTFFSGLGPTVTDTQRLCVEDTQS